MSALGLALVFALSAAPKPADAPRAVPSVAALLTPAPKKAHAPTSTACGACHVTSSWNQTRFNHARTGFPLLGKHAETNCKGCHPVDFQRSVPATCSGCHLDVHGGELGARCDGCHDPESWKSRFPADAHRFTGFPLIGRHAALPCNECHFTQAQGRFSRAASDCGACHQADFDRTRGGTVDHPALGFPTTCQSCHQPWSFKGARYPGHDACFTLTGGPHADLTCFQCHSALPGAGTPGACATGTAACTGCHEHECARSDPQHLSISAPVQGYRCADQRCYGCHTELRGAQ